MFGLTKREQRWAAEQEAANTLLRLAEAAIAARTRIEVARVDAQHGRPTPRPLAEYHEDIGPMLWWRFPIMEPPYVGQPSDDDWPGYHTHWTPIVVPVDPKETGND